MEEKNYVCASCGAIIDSEENIEELTFNGVVYCRDCFENNFITCEGCGELIDVNNDNYTQVYTDGYRRDYVYMCDNCLDECYEDGDTLDWYIDEDCGAYDYNGNWYCQENINDNFGTCEECGEIRRGEDLNYCERDDAYYCDYCFSEYHSDELIYDYHGFSDWQLFKKDDEDNVPYYIGFELEIDGNDYRFNYVTQEVHNLITSNINSVLMHDGSLTDNGIEIVSHPQSFEYIMAQREKYADTFDKLVNIGFTSHDNERCGLHFHVTRPSDEVTERVILLLENFRDEILNFSRRTSGQISHWSSFLQENKEYYISNDDVKSLYYIKKHKNVIDGNRYHALNTTNRNTIEFRFCRGTLNIETFIASVQLINNIMKIASDLSIKIEDIDWLDLTDGDDCKKYCASRGLTQSHKAIDNTSKIISRVEKIQLKHDELMKILDNYEKYIIKKANAEAKKFIIKNDMDMKKIINNIQTYDDAMFSIHCVKNDTSRIDDFGYTRNFATAINGLARQNISKYYKKIFNDLRREVEALCV